MSAHSSTGPDETRTARAVRAMSAQNVDALLLTPGADLFYLTGFEHGHAMERLPAWSSGAMDRPSGSRRP